MLIFAVARPWAAECFLILGDRPGARPIGSSQLDVLLVSGVGAVWAVTVSTVPVLPIPNSELLNGVDLYFQVALYDPEVFPTDPIKMSNGLKVTIGGQTLRDGRGSGIDLRAPMPAMPGQPFQPAFRIAR